LDFSSIFILIVTLKKTNWFRIVFLGGGSRVKEMEVRVEVRVTLV